MDNLPDQCYFSPLGASRIKEILALTSKLETIEHGQRAYQNLPRHMQRRAMSSNPRRVPRTIREKHIREVQNKVSKTKRPCRKYRRRPSNLLSDYNRRQKTHTWLETHIFHAKRFHMTRKWGYALPQAPTNKSHRATLRAATYSCLMQDVSYLSCIEIRGSMLEIMYGLSRLGSQDERLKETSYLSGQNWTSIFLYAADKYPSSAIGSVDIMWHPTEKESNSRVLWMWVHPSCYSEVLSNLVLVFSLQLIQNKDNPSEQDHLNSESSNSDSLTKNKILLRNIPVLKIPTYQSTTSSISIHALKDTLNRFRLTGPSTYAVLSKVIIPSEVEDESNCEKTEKVLSWWKDYYSSKERVDAYQEQVNAWKQLAGNDCQHQCVIPLVLRDPRVILPTKKVSIETPPNESFNKLKSWNVNSPFYNGELRDVATLSKPSTAEINSRRSMQLVPTSPLPLTASEARVPVLLLHRLPPYNSHGHGWDVILPCGWGDVTWQALHMSGGVSSGQNNEENLIQELILSPTPSLLPDTSAGICEAHRKKISLTAEHFRRPPNCRANYIKLAVQFPFSTPWLKLVKEWFPSVNEIKVLRNYKDLEKLDSLYPTTYRSRESNLEPISDERKLSILSELKERSGYLVYVHIKLKGKGTIMPNAMLCIPLETDKNSNNENLCESQIADLFLEERKKLKLEHHKIHNRLQRLKYRKRKRIAKEEDESLPISAGSRENIKSALEDINKENKDLIEKNESYLEKMNSLWLLPESKPLQMCSRKIIGYITQGGFSTTQGKSSGVGYIILNPLLDSINDGELLIRNPTEHNYFWAQISVIIPKI